MKKKGRGRKYKWNGQDLWDTIKRSKTLLKEQRKRRSATEEIENIQ
jgi:hypothetical protein